jgi:peptidoglycan hydrolase-like protein with peptidoglycan-binding domain
MNDVRNDVAKIMEGSGSQIIVDPDDIDIIISDGILRRGNEGQEVRDLQNSLIKLGYSVGRWGADGDFGLGTEEAVMNF